ncbi:unnamed protein product [Prorocentrum cordatum]|uniref:Uncharacterized protein n=1 Tax=Prorocentrum cordatum TaxID=2364126 RepID=A0ABN9Q7B8_9DINO|nr:unnamed protein product [Polarella glacialis]
MLDPNEPVSAGGIRDSSANKKKFSRSSFDYKRGRPEFRDLFPEFCDEAKRPPSGRWCLNGPPAAAEATADAESGDAAAAPAGAAGAPRPGGALGGVWLGGRALLALSVLLAGYRHCGGCGWG